MGDWGILFICCGALTAQTRSGKATLLEHLEAPITSKAIANRGDDEFYAGCFPQFIEDWSQDSVGISLATQRLRASSGKFNSENYEAALPYFSIAIMLNSLTNLDIDQFRELKV